MTSRLGSTRPLESQRPSLEPVLFVGALALTILASASHSAESLTTQIRVPELSVQGQSLLARFNALAEANEWSEDLDVMAELRLTHEDELVPLPQTSRFVPVADLLDAMIAAWPPEGLTAYRARFDREAQTAYDAALAKRDLELLRNVPRRYFAASVSDEALWHLGELYVELGELRSARAAWRRLLPIQAVGGDRQTVPANHPDPSIPAADVAARLVWLSIAEEATDAAEELQEFQSRYSQATGILGGREVHYGEFLAGFLQSQRESGRTGTHPNSGWPTFGGSAQRDRHVRGDVDVGAVAWSARWRPDSSESADGARPFGLRFRPRGNDGAPQPYCHPIWVRHGDRDLLLAANEREILAFDLEAGRPAWNDQPVVFRLAEDNSAKDFRADGSTPGSTLTARDGLLFAVMGNQVTSGPYVEQRIDPAVLVCLDLSAEGRLLWQYPAENQRREFIEDGWSLDGTPLSDGVHAYGLLRRRGNRAECHAACWDAATGRLNWRTFVFSGETLSRGLEVERSHHLIALQEGVLYVECGLGGVAAVETDSGRIRWITSYERNSLRGPNVPGPSGIVSTCVVHDGLLIVAPDDSVDVLAFEESSGEPVWHVGVGSQIFPTRILGIAGNTLIVDGKGLCGIDIQAGRIAWTWTGSPAKMGLGWGAIVGNRVYWPARPRRIEVLDAATGHLADRPIELGPRGVLAGNLLHTEHGWIISGPVDLYGISPFARAAGGNSPQRN